MGNDDLPPRRRRYRESFGSEIGATIGRAVWLLALMAIIGALIYFGAKLFH